MLTVDFFLVERAAANNAKNWTEREREKLRQQFAISILLIYMYLVCLRNFKTINFPGRKGRMGKYWIVTITLI